MYTILNYFCFDCMRGYFKGGCVTCLWARSASAGCGAVLWG